MRRQDKIDRYTRINVGLPYNFKGAGVGQQVTIVDCLGIDHSFNEKAEDEHDLLLMLKHFKHQQTNHIMVYTVSLLDGKHGIDGSAKSALGVFRSLTCKAGLPLFVFTHYKELEKKWKDPSHIHKKKTEDCILSLQEDLQRFFAKFLQTLAEIPSWKDIGDDDAPQFTLACLDAHLSLIPEEDIRAHFISSHSLDEAALATLSQRARANKEEGLQIALEEELPRLQRQCQQFRQDVGALWEQLLRQSSMLLHNQSMLSLVSSTEKLLEEYLLKEKKIRQRILEQMIPANLRCDFESKVHKYVAAYGRKVPENTFIACGSAEQHKTIQAAYNRARREAFPTSTFPCYDAAKTVKAETEVAEPKCMTILQRIQALEVCILGEIATSGPLQGRVAALELGIFGSPKKVRSN